jgi:hypothetical protein
MVQVLGLTITLVFVIGYVKLIWSNRLVKRQEMVDEEKRVRINELRTSGQIVESQNRHDIPFGIKAIQSGVQVDGIWISQNNTPVGSQLKLALNNSSPATTSTLGSQTDHVADFGSAPQLATKKHASSRSEILRDLDRAIAAQDAADAAEYSGSRSSYRPHQVSHLRYGSHGEYDQTTLHRLEGTTPPRKLEVHRPRPANSRPVEGGADSSAADNELSSGVSSHSDVSLSQNMQPAHETKDPKNQKIPNAVPTKPQQSSIPSGSSKAGHLTIPSVSPDSDDSDPFVTPMGSPDTTNTAILGSTTPHDDKHSVHSQTQNQMQFIPGELHVNKTIRKVNSGFEVLPAGTFGVPAEFKGKGVDRNFNEDLGEKRQSTKLQKKPRTSSTVERY